MNIYQNNTCRKDLSWLHFDDEPRVQDRQQVKTNSPTYLFLQLIEQFQVAARSSSSDMTTVVHAWHYGRFIEIQSSLRRKKIHKMNQGSNFLGGSFSNRDNARAPTQFRRESQPQSTYMWPLFICFIFG